MEEISKDITTDEIATQRKFNYYLAISSLIFIIVIGVSIGLHFTNAKIFDKITEVNLNIAGHSKEIDNLKNSNEVAAYDIVLSSKKEVEATIEKSRASVYIKEFINISKKYGMYFAGFAFDGSQVSTSAIYVSKDEKSDAIYGVSNFIRDYRVGANGLFALDPIGSVAGDATKRSFSVGFKIIK